MCPVAFDYLVKQDIKAKHYYSEGLILNSQIANLKAQIVNKDSIVNLKDNIININGQEKELLNLSLINCNKQLKHNKRQILGLKVGIFAISAVGLAGITYFIIH